MSNLFVFLLKMPMDSEDLLNEKPFLKDFIIEPKIQEGIDTQDRYDGFDVLPDPGFCLKIKNDKDRKTFINVCSAYQVPCPPDISEGDLLKLIDGGDSCGYRIPLSLGEPHVEFDHKGESCIVYDVIIHPRFYGKVVHSNLFLSFLATIIFDGLEAKYKLDISRDWVKLKNKRIMGKILPQRIRQNSRPLTNADTEPEPKPGIKIGVANPPAELIKEVHSVRFSNRPLKPDIIVHTDEKYRNTKDIPPSIVLQIYLPEVKSTSDVVVTGKDKDIQVEVNNVYNFGMHFKHNLNIKSTLSFYCPKSHTLFIRLPFLFL
ncbi:hypothetical protein GJ496_005092 [Pomphorhynchus laevis]|nr:hypothetical protein GJ496_005092 [Pomphorhynchus laevis]